MRMPTLPSRAAAGGNARGRQSALALRALAALFALSLTACENEPTAAELDTGTFYGAAVPLGNGTARSYVVLDRGTPEEVGVALSEDALSGLPDDHSPGGIPMPDGHDAFEYTLEMPSQNPTPYRFVGLGWNPAGHEPEGVYYVPHFDFHFYTITEAERAAIDPTDPQFQQKAENLPAPEYRPDGYAALPGAVPFMGVHWVDPTSEELNGGTFTKTFLYGSWDGKLTFVEPMITRGFLATKPDVELPIGTAPRANPAGYYPTHYRVLWNEQAGEYRVALGGLEHKH